MKRYFTLIGLTLTVFIAWQTTIFFAKAQIIEVLPVTTSKMALVDPYYPEPVRIAFDKPISIEDVHFSIKPAANLKPQIRLVRLRNRNNTSLYPAYVLSNTKGLQEKIEYEVTVSMNKKSVFDYWFPKKVIIYFRTTKKDTTLPKENGEDLDKRLFRQ